MSRLLIPNSQPTLLLPFSFGLTQTKLSPKSSSQKSSSTTMENQFQPYHENISELPLETLEKVSSSHDELCAQNTDLVKTQEAVLDSCNDFQTSEALLTERSNCERQILDLEEGREETSTEHGDDRTQNAEETSTVHEEISTASDDFQIQSHEFHEKVPTEFRTLEHDSLEGSNSPMGNLDLISTTEAISSDRGILQNQNLDLIRTVEVVSSEGDALQAQNLELVRKIEEFSAQLEFLQAENLHLTKTLDEISAERDTLSTQNLSLVESLKQIHSEHDFLQSKLCIFNNEISSLLEERSKRLQVLSEGLDLVLSVKECLARTVDQISQAKVENSVEEEEQAPLGPTSDEESKQLLLGITGIHKLAMAIESWSMEYSETRNKSFDSLESVKECLERIAKGIEEEKVGNSVEVHHGVPDGWDLVNERSKISTKIAAVYKLAVMTESWISEKDEMKRREMEELLEERNHRMQVFSDSVDSLQSIKEILERIIERTNEAKMDDPGEVDGQVILEGLDLDKDSKRLFSEIMGIDKLARKVEAQIKDHDEIRQMEMAELEEKIKRLRVIFNGINSLQSIKECLARIVGTFDEVNADNCTEEDEWEPQGLELDNESKTVFSKIQGIHWLATEAESRIKKHDEMRKKEIRELENSVVSLTEENRDISSLLKIALMEKEAVEKSLNRLKASGEQKRVAILQIAEKGLQKVGFGFMMGGGNAASTVDSSETPSVSTGTRSDGSECDEEVVSLASTVEKIMKNLRLEIAQLRRSLDESRSDNERLQSLTEKQTQKIEENTLYIKDLEERETILTQHVEELMTELTAAEEEIVRWREACELEVEAGKAAIEERESEVAILKEELEKTKASLEQANTKLKLKEELAVAAMAAQAAAERSLQLMDSRSAGFRDRIEELTRQLDEAENKRERAARRKVRHICWPWPALRINPAAAKRQDISRRRLPEMEALLHRI